MKLSRFFEWSGRWKGFARFWTFLRLIHTSLQALKASSVDIEDGDQDLQDPPEEAAGGGLSGPKDLLQKLRAMQQKKPVMDVVCSVLQDDQIRKLGWLSLVCAAVTRIIFSQTEI